MRIRANTMRAGDTIIRPDGGRATVVEMRAVDSFNGEAIIEDKDGQEWRLPVGPERWVEVDRGSWVI